MQFGQLKRREFITLIGATAAWPFKSHAQQPRRIYRLGILHNQGRQSLQFPPFYDELRRLGFVEGENLLVDGRGYAVRTEGFLPWLPSWRWLRLTPLLQAAQRLPAPRKRRPARSRS